MPLQATSGAASYDAFGGGVPVVPNYIEDVFSTYLYTGTGATQVINNGIDLAGKGGLVWMKTRSAAYSHFLADTARGVDEWLRSNTTNASGNANDSIPAFNSNGFTVGTYPNTNDTGVTFASWTFRKQPKFFDVVTFTATSSNDQRIAHLLGSVPGCIMLKGVDVSSDWFVYHRSVNAPDARQYVTYLNSTVASQFGYGGDIWGASDPTSTDFGFKSGVHLTAGKQYVAYLFAHNAGGFGLTGTDNVISCGSYTGTGATGNAITLGYEPQWLLIKKTSGAQGWAMFDVMRGFTTVEDSFLQANLSDAEYNLNDYGEPTATGFTFTSANNFVNQSGQTYIYIAIRRGPMKVPTSGTSVFAPVVRTGTNAVASITGLGFAPDSALIKFRTAAVDNVWYDRLRGPNLYLSADNTNAEVSYSPSVTSYNNTGITFGDDLAQGVVNANGISYINWLFGRAPSFFDEVCYTGTGVARTVAHNLGVVPEMMIVKCRSDGGTSQFFWAVYVAPLGNTANLVLSDDSAIDTGNLIWNDTSPTSSVFTVGQYNRSGASGKTYVAYLFATCAGVSKVGSYTGTGTTKQIDCGFTGGARFVLIKRSDSTGDWYVWDSARGIVSGNDSYLLLNSTAAEVTSTDYIDTYSAGFEISSTAPAAINASGGTFVFLAIA
jgi:hypothetical protein